MSLGNKYQVVLQLTMPNECTHVKQVHYLAAAKHLQDHMATEQ